MTDYGTILANQKMLFELNLKRQVKFLVQVTADQLLAAAASPDPEKDQRQHCEANFYIAEDALLHQDRAKAMAGFQTAAGICPQWILTHAAAVAELKRMGEATGN